MKFIKEILNSKRNIGIISMCLFVFTLTLVGSITGTTYAADTSGDTTVDTNATKACYQCLNDTTLYKYRDGTSSDDDCPAGYRKYDDSNCKLNVTFEPNGGNVNYSSASFTIGKTFSGLATATRTGYKFEGWYTAKTGGVKVTTSTKVTATGSQILYALWSEEAITVTVKFDANGGSVSPTSQTVTYNSTYKTLPTPTRTGYTFLGWYTSATGGSKYTASSTVVNPATHTLYAHWSKTEITVTFDANGGSVSPTSKSFTYGNKYEGLPTPTRTDWAFIGWYTAKTGGTQITKDSLVEETVSYTLYAQWSEQTLTVNFNLNGGTSMTYQGQNLNLASEWAKKVEYGEAYGELPVPSRTGYAFSGWYTAASGGTRKVATDTVSQNHTLYAHWTEGATSYSCYTKSMLEVQKVHSIA